MKIKGQLGEYDVVWRNHGWTGAKAIVRQKKKLFGIIPYWSELWSYMSSTRAFEAEKFHHRQFEDWFNRAVKEYEAYEKAWEGKR